MEKTRARSLTVDLKVLPQGRRSSSRKLTRPFDRCLDIGALYSSAVVSVPSAPTALGNARTAAS